MSSNSDDRDLSGDSDRKIKISQIPWLRNDLLHLKSKTQNYYYNTNDLVMIALFSALGGVLSTFVGYLGNLINQIIGIPWGGGQIVAGLHVFWIIFIYLLTDRKVGVALMTGVLKGFVEFFSGSAHGILVVVLSGTQGLAIELMVIIFLSTNRKFILAFASGIASLSNVIIQQILFFNSQIPLEFIILISGISFISGILLGGVLPVYIYRLYESSPILNWRISNKTKINPRQVKFIRIFIILIIVIFDIGVLSYLTSQNKYSVQVTGDVSNPYTYFPSDFTIYQVTVEAELIGEVTYIPPQNYTGVPLQIIVEKSFPTSDIFLVRIEAIDGYFSEFTSINIFNDPTIILIRTDSGLQIVAGNFQGSYWVKKVNRIIIKAN